VDDPLLSGGGGVELAAHLGESAINPGELSINLGEAVAYPCA
jgi:hypothetical protein